ncbi:MAG: Cys-Cys-COOH (seleno)protein SaoC [Syntrophobacteraceae bacterium]
MKRPVQGRVILCLLSVCLVAWGCGENASEKKGSTKADSSVHSEALICFKRQNPDKEIIEWAEADLNNDGRLDSIVIYRISKEKNMMRVILNLEWGYFDTNEVPAPHSEQVIQLRDIDRKPPMEFIVQGVKGIKMGYAIFRIEENRLVDLFGEGMDDCC